MEPKYVIGALFIAATVAWLVAMLVVTYKDGKRGKPRVVPELPKIPLDCIEALRARAEDPCTGYPRRHKKGASQHD